MFPYLKSKVVLVEGPAAYGLYDLNIGDFQRINKAAGRLLLSLNGLRKINTFDSDERDFLYECAEAGYISWQEIPQSRSVTPLQEVIRNIRPIRFAWIELTSKCNQLCRHCFLGDDLNAFPHYPKEEVFAMLASLHRAGARQIILSGGEPTVHPAFRDILEHAGSKYPFKLSLLTNGSHRGLLSVVDLLREYEVTVKVPLLGWEKSHDLMSGIRNGFVRTTDTIEILIKNGVHVELGTTVTGLNYEDIPKLRDYAHRLDLPLEVSPLYAVGYAVTNKAELYSISQTEILAVCKEHKKSESLIQIAPSQMKSEARDAHRYVVDPTDYDAVNLKDYLTAHSECGQKIVAILSNREVTPCLMLREKQYSLGSLNEHSLDDILAHNTGAANRFDEMMKLSNVPGCGECEARFVCKAGGCPASAKAFAGSVQVKNPLFTQCYYTNDITRAEADLAALTQ
jgi:radical SAM protein with 4Fe4S-binding SPASM domain